MPSSVPAASPVTAPGPGAWELERTHLNRPLSRWMVAVHCPAFERGFSDGTRHYGMLLERFETAVVDGFLYICPRAVGAPKGAKGPPPRVIFTLLTWLHPEIRRRNRRMAEVFATKAWREDLRRWDEDWKPAIARDLTALQAVDPTKLSDAELATHLETCRVAVDLAIWRHHRLNPCAMIALGDYLSQVGAWSGLPASDLLAPLRGASPVSLGAAPQLARAVAAIAADPIARARLAEVGDPSAALATLQAQPGEVGEAMRAWIDAVGLRITTGYDVADRSAGEMPEVLIGALRSTAATVADDGGAALARVRERVPAERRALFDELFAEARLTFRIRDERCYLNDAWATGIARRALLAAGARLVGAGRLDDAAHAVDLTPVELDALLRRGDGPSRDAISERVRRRTGRTVADAPEWLGLPPSGPPPAEWLPAGAARGMRAVGAAIAGMFEIAKDKPKAGATPDPKRLRGLGASPTSRTGVARVILSPEDFSRVQQGDIVIARNTAPSYNVLLPLLGGIVTDRGGVLCHAAIVAREYGLAAVVGCGDATTRIPDGARVRVDGATGDVEILS